MPVNHVRISGGAIHIRNKGIEPYNLRCEPRISSVSSSGIEHRRTRRKIERKVESGAGAKQVADFFVRLVPSENCIDLVNDRENLPAQVVDSW